MSADYCYDYDDPKYDTIPPYHQAKAYRQILATDYIGLVMEVTAYSQIDRNC